MFAVPFVGGGCPARVGLCLCPISMGRDVGVSLSSRGGSGEKVRKEQEGDLTGPPIAPRKIASADFAAARASSVRGSPVASIEHYNRIVSLGESKRSTDARLYTYPAEEMWLEVELDIWLVLCNCLKDLVGRVNQFASFTIAHGGALETHLDCLCCNLDLSSVSPSSPVTVE